MVYAMEIINIIYCFERLLNKSILVESIPDVGQLMLASYPSETANASPNNQWYYYIYYIYYIIYL